ncbi:class I SAM-dependent methyltransferase [Nocardioides sp. Root151]|uniref:class I SAM-dependent methyltransferase n=1 Tax=Nocardioides sp. Root151 TaxID=1736475 RepID=UPI000702BD93|nr:methyltransferase domain-containing protein [Nocardioides sp. Root151]KQZ67069.1 hypothetical protein ASD66_18935 [Nocardioides sp. Root151]
MERGWNVSRDGIRLDPTLQAMDVLFDGVRVWSFHPARDGAEEADGWVVPWPAALLSFLDGVARVTVRPIGSAVAAYDEEVTFGASGDRVSVRDGAGQPLVVDKGGRLQASFASASPESRRQLVEVVRQVLAGLREKAGLEAFLSFGCLLGAVREGRLIGHDSDADVSYLSRHTHPFDIARESRAAQRVLASLGYEIARMSADDFKIWAHLPDGQRVGIDVFGAYHFGGRLHMLPNVRGDLDRSALLPTSTVTLEGLEVVAPARPEELLEVIYGSGWRVPDPSFRYEHPVDITRHMAGYWQGARRGRRVWNEFYRSANADRVPQEQSAFAEWVAERLPPGATVVDVGQGNGRDSVWFAGRGFRVTGLDFAPGAIERARSLADQHGASATFGALNLNSPRSVLIAGSRLAFADTPAHLCARFLIDGLPLQSRRDLWLLASMAQRRGGRTFLEFRTHRSRGEPTVFRRPRRRHLDPDVVVGEIESRGGRVVERVEGRGLARFRNEDPDVCRLVVRWNE